MLTNAMQEGVAPMIFIVGNSRSGTTLVARILKRHSQMHILNETHFMEEFSHEIESFNMLEEREVHRLVNKMLTIQRKDYYRKSAIEEYAIDADAILHLFGKAQKKDFAVLNKCFFEYEARRFGKVIAGDQTPRHIFHVNEISRMYPEAKFIQMIRDPRDILLSQKGKWRGGIRHRQPWFEIIRTLLNYHPITMTILWKKVIAAGRKSEATCSSKQFYTLIFEELVKDPFTKVRELCAFIGVEYEPSMLDVGVELSSSQKEEGKRGVRASVSGKGKQELSRTEIYLAESLAETEMKRLGYRAINLAPNPVQLLIYYFILPAQLFINLVLNLGRMGNPVGYIRKRLFQK